MVLTADRIRDVTSTLEGKVVLEELFEVLRDAAELDEADADIEAGNGVPHEEVVKMVNSWGR